MVWRIEREREREMKKREKKLHYRAMLTHDEESASWRASIILTKRKIK